MSNLTGQFNEEVKIIKNDFEDLVSKGKKDGMERNFTSSDIYIGDEKKTIYNSSVIMEELSSFIKNRSRIYGNNESQIVGEVRHDRDNIKVKTNFRKLLNEHESIRDTYESNLGYVDSVKAKNYTYSKMLIDSGELDAKKKSLHVSSINSFETDIYNECRDKIGKIINSLKEEIRIQKDANDLVSRFFNYTQERITTYWNSARESFNDLEVIPPTANELLALKNETLFGEFNDKIETMKTKIEHWEKVRMDLKPQGIIEKVW